MENLNPNIALIVMGLVAVVALAVLAYAQQARKSELAAFIEPFQGVLETSFKRFDDLLAQYGAPLKPVNEIVTATATLLDSPDDFLAKVLPDAIEAGFRKVLDELKQLTDGIAASQEAQMQAVIEQRVLPRITTALQEQRTERVLPVESADAPVGEAVPYQVPASDGMPSKR